MAGNAPHIPGCRDLSLIGERVARSLFSATSDDGRPVTVTVFPPPGDGRTRAGFDRAAATAQRLGAHPSVLTIHRWGHADDGRPWVVTDPQPAEAIDVLLTMDGPLPVVRALQVGILLSGALETAHRAGIVHGDLSPAHIVFGSQGEPLLAETGLAEFAVFPGLGALNNPVRYFAPPEVLERTDVTPATDVYALGATVYALVAGQAPNQKPAEITDSNASLLLRILQMPLPRIQRDDLPAGLEDALRGPLAASPSKRPQQAIEVAWLLQDVQRRAGLAVTEPVVLDLDGSGAPVPAAALGLATGPAPPPLTQRRGPGSPAPWADPSPGSAPGSAPGPAAPAASPGPVPPASPTPPAPPAPLRPPGPPPPTVFPFAEGNGAPPPVPPTAPAGPTDDTADAPLWPSTWPADQPRGETPPWAAPPNGGAPVGGGALPGPDAPTGGTVDATPPGDVRGGDGGSIGDTGALGAPRGFGDDRPESAPPMFGPVVRPPELDELPAWYTDPLPNGPGAAGGAPWSEPPPPAPGPMPFAPDRPGNGNTPAFGTDERLPGSGDELRSLFGQVVSDPSGSDGGADRGGDWGPPPAAAEPDPLGPPEPRPPIDLSRLHAPLGPTPYLPSSPDRPDADPSGPRREPPLPGAPAARDGRTTGEPPARLPRRHELQGWNTPVGARGEATDVGIPIGPSGPSGPSGQSGRSGRTVGHGSAAGGERGAGAAGSRPMPRQVAPAPGGTAGDDFGRGAAAAGPPALPVIILVVVAALLALGVAWLVLTGDDAEPRASDVPPEAGAGDTSGAPTGLQVSQTPEGMQLTWTGAADANHVVTILSPAAPPRPLAPAAGTSALVPGVELDPSGANCFTVAVAATDGAPGTPSEPVCTPGATIDGMQQG
jgi:Protein kinase domain